MGFGGLYISTSGIYANKRALDTISHNISNANNKSYVRQSTIHAENRYSLNNIAGYQIGTGVSVQQIRQIRDEFLDLKIRNENATYGYYNTKSEILGEIETIFNEITSSGLQEVMDDFWNGWAELFKEPDSLTKRGLLHENAIAFTTTVNHISSQLDSLQFNLNKEMLSSAQEANQILEDIANLNKNIKLVEGYGENISANDYRDTLNAKLDRLSELIPITYYENQYGEVVVSLNGRDLVNADYFNPIDIRLNDEGFGEIYWQDTGGHIDLNGRGELGGYIDARDKVVTEYRERLNILVGEIASSINAIHEFGKTLDWQSDNPTAPETTGIKFFEIGNPEDIAATIKVNPDLADFNKIAASLTGAKGDGEIAKQILALRDKKIFKEYDDYVKEFKDGYFYKDIVDEFGNKYDNINELLNAIDGKGGSMSIDEFYRDLILDLSLERQEAVQIAENQELLISQIDGKRQEISGVSLDEEMADMIKYQYSYIANSRVVNAIDEMINKIINETGVVGR